MPGSTDGFLWYNVGEWQQYGLAVPNWGKDQNRKSQNSAIRDLVQIVGRNLCAVMWHADSRLRTPPSINTITRVHRLCVRARALLAANAVPANVTFMEPAHAIPAPEEHLVYPVPYFNVRNQFMKRWCNLGLLALTEAMQHQENARPLQFSVTFSGQIGQYLQMIYRDMATTLLSIPVADASKPDFTLTDAQLTAYNPGAIFTQTELIDSMPDVTRWPTEDALQPLTDGIPISYLPALGAYPDAGPVPPTSGATAVPTASFAPPPGA